MKSMSSTALRPSCSLCGSSDRTVIPCEPGYLCETCIDRIRRGRDTTTSTARTLQLNLKMHADAIRSVAHVSKRPGRECRLASDDLPQLSLQQPDAGVRLGAGQELPPQHQAWLRDTMLAPDVVALDASSARVDLLAQAGIESVALGLDLAESIGARNSLERALAHQMASAHKVALDTLSQSALTSDPGLRTRLVNASARLMSVYQTGALTLRKLRMSSDQTVVVQHVTVEGGGQAVIGDVHHEGGPGNKT